MKRIGLVCGEPLRERMAGIGVRYLELARRIPRTDLEVVLLTRGSPDAVPDVPLPRCDIRRFRAGSLREVLADCDCVVAQGDPADVIIQELPELPLIVDLYDPWLVENLHYADVLGPAVYQRDFASWALQLRSGDFFLCSSEAQRCFYLGLLLAFGRVDPKRFTSDPGLAQLIAVVPSGVPEALPEYRPLLPERKQHEKRILFGGIYDWLDPWPVLHALERAGQPDWTLICVINPNLASTPQEVWKRVEEWCRARRWWGSRVIAVDWVPADRRFDLFRDVDVLAVCHGDTLEARLSFRTRILEALAAGCPVVTTAGGGLTTLLATHGAARVVPVGDARAVGDALADVLLCADATTAAGARRLLQDFDWERVLRPLIEFCRNPLTDPFKQPRAAHRRKIQHRPALLAHLRQLALQWSNRASKLG
jgi:hypothetical protein